MFEQDATFCEKCRRPPTFRPLCPDELIREKQYNPLSKSGGCALESDREVIRPNKIGPRKSSLIVPIFALLALAIVCLINPIGWIAFAIAAVCGVVLAPFLLILFPFVPFISIANGVRDRISGKYQINATSEVIELRKKVAAMDDEIHELRRQMLLISESADFSTRLIENYISTQQNGKKALTELENQQETKSRPSTYREPGSTPES